MDEVNITEAIVSVVTLKPDSVVFVNLKMANGESLRQDWVDAVEHILQQKAEVLGVNCKFVVMSGLEEAVVTVAEAEQQSSEASA